MRGVSAVLRVTCLRTEGRDCPCLGRVPSHDGCMAKSLA